MPSNITQTLTVTLALVPGSLLGMPDQDLRENVSI